MDSIMGINGSNVMWTLPRSRENIKPKNVFGHAVTQQQFAPRKAHVRFADNTAKWLAS
jgi:hypothetical protein